MKLLCLLLIPFAANAISDHKCLPAPLQAPLGVTASEPTVRFTKTCICGSWKCTLPKDDAGKIWIHTYTYCGSPAEFAKAGGRIKTILAAADPLKSANTAEKRFPITSLSDPAFSSCPK